jgi:hypothetical protein
MNSFLAAAVLVIASSISQQAFSKDQIPELPQFQKEFIATVSDYGKQYQDAPNELKKSALVKKRLTAFASMKGDLKKVTGWYGVIKDMGTNGDGDAHLVVRIPEADMTLGTWNNAFSDSGSNTLIKNGSKLYDQIADLEEGQVIKFSGAIGKPKNFTESGQMTDPDFLFKFSSIEAVSPAP